MTRYVSRWGEDGDVLLSRAMGAGPARAAISLWESCPNSSTLANSGGEATGAIPVIVRRTCAVSRQMGDAVKRRRAPPSPGARQGEVDCSRGESFDHAMGKRHRLDRAEAQTGSGQE
jgi:hypothetical protein